jgi:hypothetical protein
VAKEAEKSPGAGVGEGVGVGDIVGVGTGVSASGVGVAGTGVAVGVGVASAFCIISRLCGKAAFAIARSAIRSAIRSIRKKTYARGGAFLFAFMQIPIGYFFDADRALAPCELCSESGAAADATYCILLHFRVQYNTRSRFFACKISLRTVLHSHSIGQRAVSSVFGKHSSA